MSNGFTTVIVSHSADTGTIIRMESRRHTMVSKTETLDETWVLTRRLLSIELPPIEWDESPTGPPDGWWAVFDQPRRVLRQKIGIPRSPRPVRRLFGFPIAQHCQRKRRRFLLALRSTL